MHRQAHGAKTKENRGGMKAVINIKANSAWTSIYWSRLAQGPLWLQARHQYHCRKTWTSFETSFFSSSLDEEKASRLPFLSSSIGENNTKCDLISWAASLRLMTHDHLKTSFVCRSFLRLNHHIWECIYLCMRRAQASIMIDMCNWMSLRNRKPKPFFRCLNAWKSHTTPSTEKFWLILPHFIAKTKPTQAVARGRRRDQKGTCSSKKCCLGQGLSVPASELGTCLPR